MGEGGCGAEYSYDKFLINDFGNFAVWNKGEDDVSSYAESFYDEDIHLSMIVAEISSAQKKMSSTRGMQLAQTAPTYSAWVEKSARQQLAHDFQK